MSRHVRVAVQRATRLRHLPSDRKLRQWASAALLGVGHRRAAELVIRLVNEAEGRRLNRVWRHKDYATNVLSFPVELPKDVRSPLLGDLVICAPVVRREAEAQGKLLEAHWAHLTVHGTLHLLGFEHATRRQAEEMEALEIRIVTRLGFSDPYTA